MVTALGADFFARPAREVAPELVGCMLRVADAATRIVEVERYEPWDAASHSFRGARGRARTMFGDPGRLYVYRSYGIHWCLNVVCDAPGVGAAILIRAAEPVDGLDAMTARRPGVGVRDLCRGPGRLAAALGVTGDLDGRPLGPDTAEILAPDVPPGPVVRTTRVGISRDTARRWRYCAAGSRFVSDPRPVMSRLPEVYAA